MGLHHRGDQVAQRLGPLGGAQHVVVDVLVVRQQRVADHVQVAAEQRVDHLAHRQHHPAQPDQVLPQFVGAALHDLAVGVALVEEQLFQLLDPLVQLLDGGEVPVHQVVEQAVQQEAHALLGQVGAGVPALDHRVHGEVLVVADGDQRVGGDEDRELAGLQRAAVRVHRDGVGAHEQVVAVAVELGALALVPGVLDGQLVQAELLVDHGEVGRGGGAEVEPDGEVRFADIAGYVLDREVLQGQVAVAVEPGSRHAGQGSHGVRRVRRGGRGQAECHIRAMCGSRLPGVHRLSRYAASGLRPRL